MVSIAAAIQAKVRGLWQRIQGELCPEKSGEWDRPPVLKAVDSNCRQPTQQGDTAVNDDAVCAAWHRAGKEKPEL